ncbi:MAG: response regulator [Roseiflexus sp.]|nr:response regulator [Roseiflexus sp.]MCS7287802.1 response regulator [Roseiflexus sp.]MDW8145684.1 response regulator [Roseiflexaceae bacterium]MDW8232124.1 response regulator [Roseiflexaceae bacterium]
MAHRTILIVDEAPDHRDILARLLRFSGYHVIEAAPSNALDHICSGIRPDLILCSLSLPGQPAWETVRQLRTLPEIAAVPILGATVYTTLIKRSRAQALGCVDYVDKPFDLDSLIEYVQYLLSAPTITA